MALIRISGHGAIELVDNLAQLPHKSRLSNAASHTIHYGWVIDCNGTHTDQVMFLLTRAPATFTGHDTIEITCHNNQLIVETIIARAIEIGARQAEPGEFAKRSYLNNKIDLSQAEAINELIHAQTRQSIEQSLAQLEGSLAHWVEGIQRTIIQVLTLCQASFEFLEDESMSFDEQIRQQLAHAQAQVASAQKQHQHQRLVSQGVRIVLLGSVNVGKSSLFNHLVGHERAIVTNIAGTTRDVIETSVYRPGCTLTFVDTAGLRHTHDIIEQEGIKRSHEQAQAADIVLLIHDASRILDDHEQKIYDELAQSYADKLMHIYTKCDVACTQTPDNGIIVSSITGYNLEKCKQVLEQRAQKLVAQNTGPFAINSRHLHILTALARELDQLVAQMGNARTGNAQTGSTRTSKDIDYELLAVQILDVLEIIGRLTGKTATDRSVDEIFKQFCVGK